MRLMVSPKIHTQGGIRCTYGAYTHREAYRRHIQGGIPTNLKQGGIYREVYPPLYTHGRLYPGYIPPLYTQESYNPGIYTSLHTQGGYTRGYIHQFIHPGRLYPGYIPGYTPREAYRKVYPPWYTQEDYQRGIPRVYSRVYIGRHTQGV